MPYRTGMALCALSLPVTGVWAQASVPDAVNQEFLRQQERERQWRQSQEKTPDVRWPDKSDNSEDPAPARVPVQETPCVTIERIMLGGDSAEKFQWSLPAAQHAPDGSVDLALPQCLGARGISMVVKRIQEAISKQGYVTTRVLVTPQELSPGSLMLTLIPGRIGDVRFAPGTEARASAWNAVPAVPGDLLNLRDIEQALENFRRVPSVDTDIQLTRHQRLAYSVETRLTLAP